MYQIISQAVDPSVIEQYIQLGVAGAIGIAAIYFMYRLFSQQQEYWHLETMATQQNIIAKMDDIERKLDTHIQYCQTRVSSTK